MLTEETLSFLVLKMETGKEYGLTKIGMLVSCDNDPRKSFDRQSLDRVFLLVYATVLDPCLIS